MKKFGYLALVLALSFPAFAYAQFGSNIQTIAGGIYTFINTVLVPLVFAAAFLVFIWGVLQYVIAGGHDEEKREQGKSLMLWGIIGFFVMASVWGLVNILRGSFTLNNTPPPVDIAPGISS